MPQAQPIKTVDIQWQILYDPKTGDPLRLPMSVEISHYIAKGFLMERPDIEGMKKAQDDAKAALKAELEKQIREEIEAEVVKKPKKKRRSSAQVAADKAKKEMQDEK